MEYVGYIFKSNASKSTAREGNSRLEYIVIFDESSYFGFVRKDSRFTIKFPILQDGHIGNFLTENMRSTVVRTFEDVKYYIRAEERRAPEYFQTLYEEMKGVTSK